MLFGFKNANDGGAAEAAAGDGGEEEKGWLHVP